MSASRRSSVATPWLDRLPTMVAPFLPPPWDGWAPVVEAGLAELIGGVSAERRAEAEQHQQGLPELAPPPVRLAQLALDFPTLHKLGQVVARDRRVGEELRSRLQMLESMASSVSGDGLRDVLERSLGRKRLRAMERSVLFETRALSEASVALVVGFDFDAGTAGRTGGRADRGDDRDEGEGFRRGVVKLLKPGIRDRLREELLLWPRVAEVVEKRCIETGLVAPDLEEVVAEVTKLLERETRLDAERDAIEESRPLLETIPGVRVPRLAEWQGRNVTTMERLAGVKATEASTESRRAVSPALVRSLIAAPMLRAEGSALFHGDPHAGNLLVAEPNDAPGGEAQLGVIDWSLSARITKTERVGLARSVAAGMTLDRRALARHLEELATGPVDSELALEAVDRALARLRRLEQPAAVRWLVGLIDDLVLLRAARFSSGLMLFRKSLLTLEGVVEDLDPRASIDRLFLRFVLEQAVRDSPRRTRSLPWSRDFGSQLSNLEIARLLTSGPRTVFNFWTQTLRAARRRDNVD